MDPHVNPSFLNGSESADGYNEFILVSHVKLVGSNQIRPVSPVNLVGAKPDQTRFAT